MTSTFSRKHYIRIAKWLGQMNETDELVQLLTNKFGDFFLHDNPSFDFKSFQSRVTREREGTYVKA